MGILYRSRCLPSFRARRVVQESTAGRISGCSRIKTTMLLGRNTRRLARYAPASTSGQPVTARPCVGSVQRTRGNVSCACQVQGWTRRMASGLARQRASAGMTRNNGWEPVGDPPSALRYHVTPTAALCAHRYRKSHGDFHLLPRSLGFHRSGDSRSLGMNQGTEFEGRTPVLFRSFSFENSNSPSMMNCAQDRAERREIIRGSLTCSSAVPVASIRRVR